MHTSSYMLALVIIGSLVSCTICQEVEYNTIKVRGVVGANCSTHYISCFQYDEHAECDSEKNYCVCQRNYEGEVGKCTQTSVGYNLLETTTGIIILISGGAIVFITVGVFLFYKKRDIAKREANYAAMTGAAAPPPSKNGEKKPGKIIDAGKVAAEHLADNDPKNKKKKETEVKITGVPVEKKTEVTKPAAAAKPKDEEKPKVPTPKPVDSKPLPKSTSAKPLPKKEDSEPPKPSTQPAKASPASKPATPQPAAAPKQPTAQPPSKPISPQPPGALKPANQQPAAKPQQPVAPGQRRYARLKYGQLAYEMKSTRIMVGKNIGEEKADFDVTPVPGVDVDRVSRKHFCIQFDEQSSSFTLTCVSARTMVVNGKVLNEDDSVALNNLDTITIGGINFVFRDDVHAGGVAAPQQRPARKSIRPQPHPQIKQPNPQPMELQPMPLELEDNSSPSNAEAYTSVRARLDLGIDGLELDPELQDELFVTADDSALQSAMQSSMIYSMGNTTMTSIDPMPIEPMMMQPTNPLNDLSQSGYFVPPMPQY